MTVSLYRQIGSHSFVDFSEKGRKWLQVVKRSSLGIVMFGFRSILVLLFYFITVVVVTGFWTHIKMNSAIFTKFSFRKIAARKRENSCISIGCILLKNL